MVRTNAASNYSVHVALFKYHHQEIQDQYLNFSEIKDFVFSIGAVTKPNSIILLSYSISSVQTGFEPRTICNRTYFHSGKSRSAPRLFPDGRSRTKPSTSNKNIVCHRLCRRRRRRHRRRRRRHRRHQRRLLGCGKQFPLTSANIHNSPTILSKQSGRAVEGLGLKFICICNSL